MKHFTFTVDDNVRFLCDLSLWSNGQNNIWEHPYLAMWKRLHECYGVKIQLNLFYEYGDFNLTHVPDRFRDDFAACSDWLRFSFHSKAEFPKHPYLASTYGEVFDDCAAVNREILRFAGEASLATTTTLHYVRATEDGVRALHDCGVRGLMGLYGTEHTPLASYTVPEAISKELRKGEFQKTDGMWHFPISCVLNTISLDEVAPAMNALREHSFVGLMIHEQYFYSDYPRYQADFEEKITLAVKALCKEGRVSCFAEELCKDCD